MKVVYLSIALIFMALVAKAEYSAVTFYVVAHQDDWQLFMGSYAYNDMMNKNVKTVFIYTTSGCAGIIGNKGYGEGYGTCGNCTMPYFRTREIGAISSIQLVNPQSKVWKWCHCWPYPEMTEVKYFFNGQYWYVKKYEYCNTVSYFLRIVDNSLKELKDGKSVVTSIEDENDHQNTYRNWSDLTSVLNKIIIDEKGDCYSFWVNTHETDVKINPNDHDDHIYTGLACQEATKGLIANYNYFIGYYSANLGQNLSPAAAAIEGGLLAAYNKAKIDAGWWDDWEPSMFWCASNYNRVVYDTTHSSIRIEDLDKEQFSISCSPNPNTGNKLYIKYNLPEDKKISIELINSTGYVLAQIENDSVLSKGQYDNELDISGYPCGLYFVRLISGGEIITTGKFLKR